MGNLCNIICNCQVSNNQVFEGNQMDWQAWGKIDTGDLERKYHPLAHHCMDVAAVFIQMMDLSVVRSRMESTTKCKLTEIQIERLGVIAFLHDIGKLHPGFQVKGWPKQFHKIPTRNHSVEGWSYLISAFRAPNHLFHKTISQINNWGASEKAISQLLASSIAHHGYPVKPPTNPKIWNWDQFLFDDVEYNWRCEAKLIDDLLHHWFPKAFEVVGHELPDIPLFQHYFAGLIALADWIGSDQQFFEFSDSLSFDYKSIAFNKASEALKKIGYDTRKLVHNATTDFHKLTGFQTPNAPQSIIGNLGPEAHLTIFEAETGSGKTEAAFWRFMHLFSEGKVSSLYFAVPTRAAASQIHERIVKMVERGFDTKVIEAVLAIPGRLKAGEYSGKKLPGWKVLWDDEGKENSVRWAAEHSTRFLASMVSVGTVDQAMLAGLEVKHAHMRGSALARSLLVIDEVHASDSYMTTIQHNLLKAHLKTGGYAMLMSATLGSRARSLWLNDKTPDYSSACKDPYPAVWVKGSNEPLGMASYSKSKSIRLKIVESMNPSITALKAIEAAKKGARVLVIRNTVNYAVQTWNSIRDSNLQSLIMQIGGGPALHHGRFSVEDRLILDKAVVKNLGAYKGRKPQGIIVIGTQTLEQSLDIDADFLITDLCPMDVLLQRIGRLHRHNLNRPDSFSIPQAIILAPEGGLDPFADELGKFENGIGVWKENDGINGIYRDLACLELTLQLAKKKSYWKIPKMNRNLVESTTHPECVEKLLLEKGDSWRTYERRVGGTKLAEKMLAELNFLDRNLSFLDLNFPNSDEKVMTRLGEEGVVLSIDPPQIGPFGENVSRIAIPAQWSKGIKEDTFNSIEQNKDELVLISGEKRFNYSREGLCMLN